MVLRWDIDERGRGVASGKAFVPNVAELTESMSDPGWVTEEPEAHLLPHLQKACGEPGSVLRLESARSVDEVFVVELVAREPACSAAELRRAAFALVGAIAEDSTHVRQRRAGMIVEFDVSTGTVPSETPYAPHGHLIRLRVRQTS